MSIGCHFYTVIICITEKGGPVKAFACDSKEEVCRRIRERWPWEHFPWYDKHTVDEILANFMKRDDSKFDNEDMVAGFKDNSRIVYGHGEAQYGAEEGFIVFKHVMDKNGRMVY